MVRDLFEGLLSQPLLSNGVAYVKLSALIPINNHAKHAHLGPSIWKWLVKLQEACLNDQPPPSFPKAFLDSISFLHKIKSSLSVADDDIVKLILNILIKFLEKQHTLNRNFYEEVFQIINLFKLNDKLVELTRDIVALKALHVVKEEFLIVRLGEVQKTNSAKFEGLFSLFVKSWKVAYTYVDSSKLWIEILNSKIHIGLIRKAIDKLHAEWSTNPMKPELVGLIRKSKVHFWHFICLSDKYTLCSCDWSRLIVSINGNFELSFKPITEGPHDEFVSNWAAGKIEIFRTWPNAPVYWIRSMAQILVGTGNSELQLRFAKVLVSKNVHEYCLFLLVQNFSLSEELQQFFLRLLGHFVKSGFQGLHKYNISVDGFTRTKTKDLEKLAVCLYRLNSPTLSSNALHIAWRWTEDQEAKERIFGNLIKLPLKGADLELGDMLLDPVCADLYLESLLKRRDVSEDLKVLKNSESSVCHLFWHLYWTKKYWDAPVEELLQSVELETRGELARYQSLWSLASGENDGDVCFGLLTCDLHKRIHMIQEAVSRIKENQDKLRAPDRDYFLLSEVSDKVLTDLLLLYDLYSLLGTLKPAKVYLEQAFELVKSVWPKRKALLKELAHVLPQLGQPLRPVLDDDHYPFMGHEVYQEYPQNEYAVADLFQMYTNNDPYSFCHRLYGHLVHHQLSKTTSLGLLAFSSHHIYACRYAAETLQPFEGRFENLSSWLNHIKEFNAAFAENVLFMTLDPFKSRLILANSHRIMILPAEELTKLQSELDKILEENKKSLFDHGKDPELLEDPNFKRSWWKTRQALDKSIVDVVKRIDSLWLIYLKALFYVEEVQDRLSRMKAAVEQALQIQCNDDLAHVLLSFGSSPKASLLEILLPFVFGQNIPDKANAIKDLRRCYEQAGRDEEVFHDEPVACLPDELILVLDKHLHCFPWEMTETLKDIRVYRQPSFWHLMRARNAIEGKEGVSYILNPGGDLKRTEEFFSPRLSQWNGIVGRKPDETEFLASLSESELFMYFGHGGGDAYVSGSKIRALKQPAAPSFLIGCSSGKIKTNGQYCPEGVLLNYLITGCPTVLVNLWDVTDKDIDKFTHTMLVKMGVYPDEGEEGGVPMDLASAANQGRQTCFLRHLNGAAPVIYGLPFTWT